MRSLPSFSLGALLKREANNLDLVRLICACLVIYGHSFILTPDPHFPSTKWDPFSWLGYEGVYSASVAVKIFFFISGLLVTHSLLTKRSVMHYLRGRAFRIWPALAVVLVITAFVIGPIFTPLSLKEYFHRFEVYEYVAGNLLMTAPERLPGVFLNNPLPQLVNGSLWTLRFEVAAYLVTLFLAVSGLFRYRWLCAMLLLVIAIDPLLPQPVLFRWLPKNPQLSYLPVCFALGAFMAMVRGSLTLSPQLVSAVILGFVVLRHTLFGPLLFHVALFVTLLYLSGLSAVRRWRMQSDLSYGTYLWGFLIQQMIAANTPGRSAVFNLSVSLGGALAVAFCSWHLIEKPALRFGKDWLDAASPRREKVPEPALSPASLVY